MQLARYSLGTIKSLKISALGFYFYFYFILLFILLNFHVSTCSLLRKKKMKILK